MSLKFKSTGAIVILVLVLSSLSVLTYVYMKQSVAKLSEMIDITVSANNLRVLGGTATEGLPTEIENFALHPSEEKERQIQETFARIESELLKIESKASNEDERIQILLVRNMFANYQEGFFQITKFVKERSSFSHVLPRVTSIKETSVLIGEAVQKFISGQLSIQQNEKETLSRSINRNGILLVGSVVFFAVLAILVFYQFIICQSIIHPLQAMKDTMQKISTDANDIKLRVQPRNDDEIGNLAIFFNQMADTIQKYNEHLEEIVDVRTRQLREAQALLLQSSKLSALGEMAGGIAHEINTPLTIISMKAEQLEDRVGQLAEWEKVEKKDVLAATSVIGKTVLRISKIVSGLRSFARDGSKDVMVTVPATDLIKDSLSLCAEKFANDGIQIRVKSDFSPGQEPEIRCRETEIIQVLINLLNNSFDAIQSLPERWIQISLETEGEFVLISVVDSGRGIPTDIQEKLMQPFFTTKEIGKGTGLGLSISRGIMESHSGKLFLDNSSAHTKFTIRLPLAQRDGQSGSQRNSA